VQLRTAGGRVLLGGQEPRASELPDELDAALREWAAVTESVLGAGRPAETELIRRRGRQLAARVAKQRGVPVEYVDPVTGAVEPVPAPDRSGWRPSPVPRVPGPEPTPWVTGLTVSVVVAIVVAVADLALYQGLVDSTFMVDRGLGWLPLVANLLVGAGLAPSLWLLRHKPFWRWLAAGVAAGLAIAWVCMLVYMLLAPA
jgi:hypothetical protein